MKTQAHALGTAAHQALLSLTTQGGRAVLPTDRITVTHNDSWHRDESNFGQWYVAVEYPGVANYDSPYDPILWMPRTGYVGGSDKHKAKSEELRLFAEAIAAMIRSQLAA